MNFHRKAYVLIILGVFAGSSWFFIDDQESASPDLQQACEAVLRERSETVEKMLDCRRANYAALMTAKSAEEAARSVSSVNQKALWVHILRSFLLGMAFAFIGIGGFLLVRKNLQKNSDIS